MTAYEQVQQERKPSLEGERLEGRQCSSAGEVAVPPQRDPDGGEGGELRPSAVEVLELIRLRGMRPPGSALMWTVPTMVVVGPSDELRLKL